MNGQFMSYATHTTPALLQLVEFNYFALDTLIKGIIIMIDNMVVFSLVVLKCVVVAESR